MSNAYYASRSELLQWLNETFGLNYKSIQECGSGAAYCQIIDSTNPGSVMMDKVDWNASHEYECANNYKILQKAFDKNRIDKEFDSEKLMKKGLQENLAFLQWIKHYWDVQTGHMKALGYDAAAQREVSTVRRRASGADIGSRPRIARAQSGFAVQASELEHHKKEIMALKQKMKEDQEILDEMENERNFYFNKLRQVEILCQEKQDSSPDPDTIAAILKILYAVDE